MKYFIGLDAHSTTSTFAVVDGSGRCKMRETVKTSEQALYGVINQIKGERHLTFEESTISHWLYLTLKDSVDNLLVCNPVYVAKKQGAKTDFRDALHLAQELRTGHLQPVFHDDSHWMDLRVSVNGYRQLVQEIVRTKNRLKSVFRAEAIRTDDRGFYGDKERILKLRNDSARFVAGSLFSRLETMETEKLKYRQLFLGNKKKYRPVRNLASIPGIREVRANVIAALVCQPNRFHNKHRFWGYCMLVRHIQKSGGKIYGNKRFFGRRELRDAFIGAAESNLRAENGLRDFYDSLRSKGTGSKDAKVALARKIASIALACLKNNDTYNDNHRGYLTERKKLRELVKGNTH